MGFDLVIFAGISSGLRSFRVEVQVKLRRHRCHPSSINNTYKCRRIVSTRD